MANTTHVHFQVFLRYRVSRGVVKVSYRQKKHNRASSCFDSSSKGLSIDFFLPKICAIPGTVLFGPGDTIASLNHVPPRWIMSSFISTRSRSRCKRKKSSKKLLYLGLELVTIAINVSDYSSAPSQASNHRPYSFV